MKAVCPNYDWHRCDSKCMHRGPHEWTPDCFDYCGDETLCVIEDIIVVDEERGLWTPYANSLGSYFEKQNFRVFFYFVGQNDWIVSVQQTYEDFPAETRAYCQGVGDHELITWDEERLA